MSPHRNAEIMRAFAQCSAHDIPALEAAGIYTSEQHFFPVITYPPPIGLPAWDEASMFRDRDQVDLDRLTCYIHVPFCLSRCTFCHWVVNVGSNEERVQRYLNALDAELGLFRQRLGVEGRLRPTSILVGGGTPTYPAPKQFGAFFDILARHLDLSRCRQFSVEAEPSTLLGPEGDERLAILRHHRVDRVSMGVQSFDDELLKSLGRTHSGDQATRAIDRLHEEGIGSVSIDLIYGLANQSLETWVDTMRQCVQSGADAWQLYQLRILPHGDKPGKVIEQYQRDSSRFPDLADVTVMKQIGWNISEDNGFDQHYTRIFARSPEHISYYLHDVNIGLYDVVGAGISSWSNIGRSFSQNVGDNFPRYYEATENGKLPVDRGMYRDDDDELRRSIILPLKNTHVDLPAFQQRFGFAPQASVLGPALERLIGLGLIEASEQALRLSRRGRFFADEVLMQLFPDHHKPSRQLAPAPAPTT